MSNEALGHLTQRGSEVPVCLAWSRPRRVRTGIMYDTCYYAGGTVLVARRLLARSGCALSIGRWLLSVSALC